MGALTRLNEDQEDVIHFASRPLFSGVSKTEIYALHMQVQGASGNGLIGTLIPQIDGNERFLIRKSTVNYLAESSVSLDNGT